MCFKGFRNGIRFETILRYSFSWLITEVLHLILRSAKYRLSALGALIRRGLLYTFSLQSFSVYKLYKLYKLYIFFCTKCRILNKTCIKPNTSRHPYFITFFLQAQVSVTIRLFLFYNTSVANFKTKGGMGYGLSVSHYYRKEFQTCQTAGYLKSKT